MAKSMRIGELAERAGVTPRTIRYYEGLGLLPPCERSEGCFRRYDEAEIARLQKIDALKALGLSLEDIREVISLYFADPTGVTGKRRVLEILRAQLVETDDKLAALRTFRTELLTNIERYEAYLVQHGGD